MKGTLLYKMVQEGLSGEVTSEQRLVWDDGTYDEVAGESVPEKRRAGEPKGGRHVRC